MEGRCAVEMVTTFGDGGKQFQLDATRADMGRRQGQQKVARDVMQQMLQWDAAFFLHRSIPSTEDVLRVRCRWKVSNCRHFLDTCITLPIAAHGNVVHLTLLP